MKLVPNSTLIKIKDVKVKNININMPDGNGYFTLVGTLNEIIPGFKNIVCVTIVAFDSLPGAVVPYVYLEQTIPSLYLYSSAEGTADVVTIRISYI